MSNIPNKSGEIVGEMVASAGSAIISSFDLANPLISYTVSEIFSRKKRDERIKTLDERAEKYFADKVELFKRLKENEIEAATFENHLNNEINRKMKKQYGMMFFTLTTIFSLFSYAIIIINAILKWNIPEFAITALIIEIPIQFVGILLIVAKNLFPEIKTEK